MEARPKSKSSWLALVILIAAIAVWLYDQKKALGSAANSTQSAQHTNSSPQRKPATNPHGKAERRGRYELYQGCTVVDFRNNDGDSFMVKLPNGKQAEFRLYYVDTPESAFKSYRDGQTNHQRIHQQAADLGGITDQQAVEIGQQAKHFTLGLLASKPFTLYTEWDSPFHDNRFHAHVQVMVDGKPRWLHQLLVERGFVRIFTKPADLPDGTPAATERNHLRALEREAKRNQIGVWGL